MKQAKQLLDYVATYPNTFLCFHPSNMILNVDNDVAYLIAPKAKIRIAGFYHPSSLPTEMKPHPLNNGILVEFKTLQHGVESAAEGDVAGDFTAYRRYYVYGVFYARLITHNSLHM